MKQIFTKKLYLLILSIAISMQSMATIRYVKPISTGTGDGSTWANAADTLNGILQASQAGDEVWVANGVYKPTKDWTGNSTPTNPREKTFYIPAGVTLRGGFVGTETNSNQYNITNHSELSGDIGVAGNRSDNCYHIVTAASANLSTGGVGIIGFEIVDGYNDITNGSIITINGNNMPHNYGAGIFVHGGNNSISNNIIKNNISNYAAAIYLCNTQGELNKNAFINDTAYIHTATIFADSSDQLFIRSNIYYSNYSDTAVLSISNSNYVEIESSIFALNKGGNGGCALQLFNNAIPRIFATQFASNSLVPSVVAGSAPIELQTINNTVQVWNSGFQMPSTNPYLQGISVISPCIFSAPTLLLDTNNVYGADGILYTADDGLQLSPNSPLIDVVSTLLGLTTDILEQPRIFSAKADANPYEATYLSITNVYVDVNAVGFNNGTSWADAYTNLDSALLSPNKINVFVAQGTYRPSICNNLDTAVCSFEKKSFLINNRQVYGSFPTGGNGVANIKLYPTILEGMDTAGNQVEHVVIISGTPASPAEVRNCIIQNGKALSNSYDTIPWFNSSLKNIINNNAGAAIHAHLYAKIDSCIIQNNFSGFGNIYGVSNGAGTSNLGPSDVGNLYLMHNQIINNTANLSGGVIYSSYNLISEGNLYAYNITNVGLSGNVEVGIVYSSPTNGRFFTVPRVTDFINDVFYKNYCKKQINSYLLFAVNTDSIKRQMTVSNCLFNNNYFTTFGTFYFGNLCIKNSGTEKKVNVVNTIFTKNVQIDDFGSSDTSAAGDLSYSPDKANSNLLNADTNAFNIYNCYLSNGDSIIYGSGNYNRSNLYNIGTPNFVDALSVLGADSCFGTADDGLHLKPNSILINKGNSNAPLSTIDAKGQARVSGVGIDIGPYELQLSCQPIITYTPNCIGNANTIYLMHNQAADSTIWFADSLMTIAVDTGYNYTTPILMDTTIYWVLIKGCNTTPYKVVVNVVPHFNPTITIATALLHCKNGTDTLTASGANTYNWLGYSTSNPLIITNLQNATTYTILGTDTDGCVGSTTLFRTVDTLPNVQANVNKAFVCEGDSILLYGSGAVTYTWANGIIDSVYSKPTYGPNIYTVIGTDANGCSYQSNTTIIVNKNQNPQVSLSNTIYCNTNDINLSIADTVYNTVPMLFDKAYNTPVASTSLAFSNKVLRDSITVSGINSVLQKKEDLILTLSLNAFASKLSIFLTAPSGKRAAIYNYSPFNPFFYDNNKYFNAADTITFNQFGPNAFSTGDDNYFNYPKGSYYPAYKGNINVNVLDSFINEPLNGKWYIDFILEWNSDFNIAYWGITLPNRVANTIQVSPTMSNLTMSMPFMDTISKVNLVPPTGTTIYTVTSSNISGCSATTTFSISNNTPNLQVTYAPYCAGDSIIIKATGAYNYFWPNGTQYGANSITDTAVFVTPDTGASYTITANNEFNQCPATVTISPVANMEPSISAIFNQSPVACGNTAVVLTAISITPNTTVQWASNIGATPFAIGMLVNYIPPFTTTIYTNAVDTITGCKGTTYPFVVNTLATAPPPTLIGDTICGTSGTAIFKADTNTCQWINWYADSTTTTKLASGNTYTANISSNTTLYAAAINRTDSVIIPAQTSTISLTGGRGYYFVAPKDFMITSLYIPNTASTNNQNIAVVKFNGLSAIPISTSPTNSFTTLYQTNNNSTNGKISVCIAIKAGDSIGIIGARGNVNSYNNTSSTMYIDGVAVTIKKLATSTNMATLSNLWTDATSNIGRINFDYITDMGCESPRTAVTAFVGNPIVTASAGTNPSCAGTDNQLFASGASTYLWNTTFVNAFNVFTFNGIDTVFTVTGTDAYGCTGTSSVTINTIPPPVIDFTGTIDTVCSGTPAFLVATSGTANMSWWDAPNGNLITNNAFINYTANVDTTFYVRASTSVCATGFIQVPVHIKPLPQVNIAITSNNLNNAICANGFNKSFTVSNTAPITYEDTINANQILASLVCSALDSSNFSNGLPAKLQLLDSIKVNTATITNLGDTLYADLTGTAPITSIDRDSTITIQVFTTGSVYGKLYYDYSNDGDFTDLPEEFYLVPNAMNSNLLEVSLPSYTFFPSIDYHRLRVVLSSTANNFAPCNINAYNAATQIVDCKINIFGKRPNTLQWNLPTGGVALYNGFTNPFNALNINNEIYFGNGLPNNTYPISVTNTVDGCSVTDYDTIRMQNPTITITTDSMVCPNAAATLSANSSYTGGGFIFWYNSFFTGPYWGNNDVRSVDTNLYYYASFKTTEECYAFDSIKFTNKPQPTLSITNSHYTICQGDSATYIGSGADTLTWSNGIINGQAFAASVTNTYTLTGTDANGCSNTQSITLQVNPLPPLNLQGPNYKVCNQSQFGIYNAGPYLYQDTINANPSTVAAACTTQNLFVIPGTEHKCFDSITINGITIINDSIKAYHDYTALGAITNLYKDTTYTLTVYSPVGKWIGAYLDYDRDGIFNNFDETLQPLTKSTSGITTITVDKNYYQYLNHARLRIFAADTIAYEPCTGFANFAFYQRADYAVNLVDKRPIDLVWNIPAGGNFNSPNSVDWYNGLAAGTYNFTAASTLNGCTNSQTINVEILQPQSLQIYTSPIVCDGDSVQFLAGGAGIDSSSIEFSNFNVFAYQQNGSLGLPDSSIVYYVIGSDTNYCQVVDSIQFTIKAKPTVTANKIQASTCPNTSVLLYGAGAQNYTWINGIIDSQYFAATTSAIYTVVGADAYGCTNEASIIVGVASEATKLALAINSNGSSVAGIEAMSQIQPDNTTLNYVDINCDLIASINDAFGGNVLGTVNAQVKVDTNIPTNAGNAYSPRWFSITPTNQGAATITLYQTQGDFNEYNVYAIANNLPLLPINENDAAAIANIRVLKVDGGSLGSGAESNITPTVTWNSANNYWELSFGVSSFSEFYIFGGTGAPLSINIVLQGTAKATSNELLWKTSTIENIETFTVQKWQHNSFEPIATVNSSTHTYTDNSISNSSNHYRILATTFDGEQLLSNTISLHHQLKNNIAVYPNPGTGLVNIEITTLLSSAATIKVIDATGKLVKQVEINLIQGVNKNNIDISELSSGIYTVHIIAGGINKIVSLQKL